MKAVIDYLEKEVEKSVRIINRPIDGLETLKKFILSYEGIYYDEVDDHVVFFQPETSGWLVLSLPEEIVIYYWGISLDILKQELRDQGIKII